MKIFKNNYIGKENSIDFGLDNIKCILVTSKETNNYFLKKQKDVKNTSFCCIIFL